MQKYSNRANTAVVFSNNILIQTMYNTTMGKTEGNMKFKANRKLHVKVKFVKQFKGLGSSMVLFNLTVES